MRGPSQISVLFSLRGFLGQVFSGHPGTLTCSFSFVLFAPNVLNGAQSSGT